MPISRPSRGECRRWYSLCISSLPTQVSGDESMPLELFAAPPFPRDLSMSAAPALLTEGPSGRRGLPSACARTVQVALQIPPKIWNNLPGVKINHVHARFRAATFSRAFFRGNECLPADGGAQSGD